MGMLAKHAMLCLLACLVTLGSAVECTNCVHVNRKAWISSGRSQPEPNNATRELCEGDDAAWNQVLRRYVNLNLETLNERKEQWKYICDTCYGNPPDYFKPR